MYRVKLIPLIMVGVIRAVHVHDVLDHGFWHPQNKSYSLTGFNQPVLVFNPI